MTAGRLWGSLVCALCTASLGPGLAEVEPTARVLTLADHDWAPFQFAGDPGGPSGIVSDLLQLCLDGTDIELELRFYPLDRMFAYLEDGRLDLNVMSYRPGRTDYAVYGREALFTSSYRPFVRVEHEGEIESLEDLDPLRLGHLAGLQTSPEYQRYVNARATRGTITTTTTHESLLNMLVNGRIDAFVLPQESLTWRAQQLGLADRIKAGALDLDPRAYFLTASKRSASLPDPSELLTTIDDCLAAAKADGRHPEILAAYGIR